MMEPQREAYKAEAYELLAELETSLLALEEDPGDMELIGRVFRALHTIKGSGAMFGFDDIAAFTHDVDTVFDLVRNGKLGVTKMLVDLTLRAGDRIRGMLDGSDGGATADASRAGEITSALRELIPKTDNPAGQVPQAALPATEDEQVEKTYRISLRLDREIFSRGANPVLLLNELRGLGECRVIAHTEAIPELEDIDPEQCLTSWEVILTTRRGVNAIKDVFIFVEDECELEIEVIDDELGLEDVDDPPKRLGEILIERGLVSQQALHEALGAQKRVGELLVDKGLVEPGTVESALAEQEQIRAFRSKYRKEEQTSSVRVPAERLDALVNLVGEMVTVQARLSQTVASMDHAELLSISEEVERLTAELRDNAMSHSDAAHRDDFQQIQTSGSRSIR